MLIFSAAYRIANPSLVQVRTPQEHEHPEEEGPMAGIGQLMQRAAENPSDVGVLTELGRRFLVAGEHDKALHFLDRGLVAEPGSAELLNLRGVALGSLGNNAEAAESFALALEADPDLTMARFHLALAQAAMDQKDEAERNLKLLLGRQDLPESLAKRAREALARLEAPAAKP